MRLTIFITTFFLSAAFLQAQNFKISGKVSDKGDHSVLIGASVILKTMPDSSDFAVITTDANGQFDFGG
ncbi:MAG TPA: hypothetical protein PKY97_04075, partial [Saprospiraceae bacterium]|nr:hypothetical protein [Saprospiraceae bacterium]